MSMTCSKTWLGVLGVLTMACVILPAAWANTKTGDEIAWTYTIVNGEASLGSGSYKSTAVPQSTTGDITIPATLNGLRVTSIGRLAFYNCHGLTSITVPDGVTVVGDLAFSGCDGLTNMTIGAGVTNIGYAAFNHCRGLSSVTIPDSVTGLGYYAFYNCSHLERVTIGEGLTSIGYNGFYGCSSLTNIVVASRNPAYSSLNGVLFSRDQTSLTAYPEGRQGGYAIPDSVTHIGEYAFSGCSGLTGVTMPNGLLDIGRWAFSSCSGLADITVPNGVTSIGEDAFRHCNGLTNVVIGAGVTNIGLTSFVGCTRLPAFDVADENQAFASRDGVMFSRDGSTLVCCPGGKAGVCSIPDGVESIGPYALAWCAKLKSVSVPSSLQSVGDYAFFYCSAMDTLFMPLAWEGKSLTNAHIRANCRIIYGTRGRENVAGTGWEYFVREGEATVVAADGRGEVAIPERLGGCPVTGISPYAFAGCEGLTGVDIPAGVTDIGSHAFFGCGALAEVVLPDSVTNIGSHAFCGCAELGGVEIPDGVAEIGDYAFSGCKGLREVVLPDTVRRIGKFAFHDCTGLTGVAIGSGVEEIGAYAFAKCGGLAGVTIPGNVKSIGECAFFRCTGLAELVLREGVERIGSLAFSGCDGLASAMVPASVAELGDNPFAGCKGLMEMAVAPGSGGYAGQDGVLFSKDGTVLVGVPAGRGGVYVLPDGVEELGAHAFDGCAGLTALEVGGGNACFASRDGALFSKDMTRLLVCPAGKAGAFAVPGGVRRIEDRAFAGCRGLTRILIPESVEGMGTNAFDRCDGLVALFVPTAWEGARDGNQTLKGARIRAGWKILHGTLESETVDGVEWHWFTEDEGAVVLPGDYGAHAVIPTALGGRPVTRIGDYAFHGCGELESVAIPGGVTEVGDYAFYGCEGLERVALPDSVRSVGKWAFGGCKGLKNVDLPDGVIHIGDRAFFGCSGLPEAVIPDSVGRIGVNAFYGNSALTTLDVGSNNATYASQEGVLFSKDMEKLLWCPDGKTGSYTIPGSVKTLAYRAFGDCAGLTAGTVPESVERIGRNSFYGCRGLAVLYVPASWEGEPQWLDMLVRAKLPPECRIVYLNDNPEETTSSTPVPVPFEWLEENAREILEENGGDYEAAAGATASNGLAVWECYLAGLDPECEDAAFMSKMAFVDGKSVVTWEPDLNEGGTKTNRAYRVWGKKDPMDEDWTDTTDVEDLEAEGWRIFRVGVELAE